MISEDVFSGPRVGKGHRLGAGVIRPLFHASHGDLASDEGVPTVLSNLGQILGTAKGTLPWRPEFGSDLQALRHRANNPLFRDLAKTAVSDALARWEPRATLRSISIPQGGNPNELLVRARISIQGAEGEHTLDLGGRQVSVPLRLEPLAWSTSSAARPARGLAGLVPTVPPVVVKPPVVITGLRRPIYRGQDLHHGEGVEQVLSNVGEVLGTQRGTLPWEPDFGSDLHTLRHRPNNPVLRELALTFVQRALQRWEPRARAVKIELLRRREGGAENVIAIQATLQIAFMSQGQSGHVITVPLN